MNSTSLISPSSFPFSANSFRAKKILIVHASVGAGHKRCAEALEAALKELGSPVIIKTIDILDYSAKGFALMYKEMYLQLVQKLWGQYLVGYFYEHSNHSVAVSKLKQKLKLNVEKSFFLSFLELIYDFNPDIVVNTHFLAAEIIADLRKKEHVFIPQVTVVTDFDAHFFWANQPTDHYFVPREETARMLTSYGIPEQDISITGIPIFPSFSKPISKSEVLKANNLKGDRPIILLISSGASLSKIYKELLQVSNPMEIIVVCGRQADVRDHLKKIPVPTQHNVLLLGFTEKIHEFMAISSLIITKPGGLTTSESLACGLAMVLVDPVQGQETRNCDMLLENGIAIKVNDIVNLSFQISKLLSEPNRLQSMQQNAKQMGKPLAAFDIAKYVINFSSMKK